MDTMTFFWGFRLLLFFSSGEDAESVRAGDEHFSLYGPAFHAKPLRETVDAMPSWMSEEDDTFAFLPTGGGDEESPRGSPSWAALTRPFGSGDPQAPPPKSGQEKPDPQAPPPKE